MIFCFIHSCGYLTDFQDALFRNQSFNARRKTATLSLCSSLIEVRRRLVLSRAMHSWTLLVPFLTVSSLFLCDCSRLIIFGPTIMAGMLLQANFEIFSKKCKRWHFKPVPHAHPRFQPEHRLGIPSCGYFMIALAWCCSLQSHVFFFRTPARNHSVSK